MAVPPNIPTSFVPKAPASERRSPRFDMGGVFGFLCYAALFVVLVLAAGVFGYKMVLTKQRADNTAKLEEMRKDALQGVAQDYIRLDGKLKTAGNLLNSHISAGRFFSILSDELPTGVRLASLHLAIGDDGKIAVSGVGVAKNFNTLASASSRFAANKHLVAVFSKLSVAKDGSVGFSLAAAANPDTVTFKAPEEQMPQETPNEPVATSSEQTP